MVFIQVSLNSYVKNVSLRGGNLMKRALIVSAIIMTCTVTASAADEVPEPTQRADAPYRLFRSQNMYTMLKLDTRTGEVWQLQWSNKGNRFVERIGGKRLPQDGKAGRFTLYPTKNIYNFILLDQEDGSAWQVQWGEEEQRMVLPIPISN